MNRSILLVSILSSFLIVGTKPVSALSKILYSGSGFPESEGYLAPGAINSSGIPVLNTNDYITTVTNGVDVDTRIENPSSGTGYLGYSNYNPYSGSFINSSFPDLDRDRGYSIFFDVAIDKTSSIDGSQDRAPFSFIAISSDLQGIEFGFDTDGIFAQNVGFTKGEATSLDTSLESLNYELKVLDSQYDLFNGGDLILSGSLRDYEFDENNSEPPLPFDPYEIENFVFLGDSTDAASGIFTLGAVSVTTASVPFEFSPGLGLGLSGLGILAVKIVKRKIVIGDKFDLNP